MNTEQETTNVLTTKPPTQWRIGRELQVFQLFGMDTPQRAKVRIKQAWPVTILGFEAFTFYVHLSLNKEGAWSVTEGYTGVCVANGYGSRKSAIENAVLTLTSRGMDTVRPVIMDAYKKHGYIHNQRLTEVESCEKEIGVDNISGVGIERYMKMISVRYPRDKAPVEPEEDHDFQKFMKEHVIHVTIPEIVDSPEKKVKAKENKTRSKRMTKKQEAHLAGKE